MLSRKRRRRPPRKVLVFGLSYMAWRIVFPIVVSPLVLGWLTFSQMGFDWETIPLGVLVAVIVLAFEYMIPKRSSKKVLTWIYTRGLGHIETREEYEEFWAATLRGCKDGFIAETHWSGTVLPLLMMAFGSLGLPYPINAIPAIFLRWVLHVGAHVMAPRVRKKERAFGAFSYFSVIILLSDVKNSVCFLLTGSIVTPILLHHLDSYISMWAGSKEKVAEKLGLPPAASA